jgi:hypothetical protein
MRVYGTSPSNTFDIKYWKDLNHLKGASKPLKHTIVEGKIWNEIITPCPLNAHSNYGKQKKGKK